MTKTRSIDDHLPKGVVSREIRGNHCYKATIPFSKKPTKKDVHMIARHLVAYVTGKGYGKLRAQASKDCNGKCRTVRIDDPETGASPFLVSSFFVGGSELGQHVVQIMQASNYHPNARLLESYVKDMKKGSK
ncbi:hypothetical protein KY349_03050 [Candidatus Woesearchaeota archaeon]|nr:hypothetical protein [Candidatus Woesearchaeota archaeon]